MALVIASNVTVSTAAYTKSADQVSGSLQNVGKGKLTLVAKGSAIGLNLTLSVNGIALMNDLAVPFFGATGSLSMQDHIVLSQVVAGGRVEFYIRNTTAGALTLDYSLLFEPM